MSNPLSSMDVEDVLASIRRIVEDGGPARAPRQPDPLQTTERLVLTPALRVHDDAAPADPNPDPTQEIDQKSAFDAMEMDEDEGAFDFAAVIEATKAADDALPPDAAALSEPDETIDSTPQPLLLTPRMSFADRASLEATIAELEAAVTAQPDEWEPDGSETRPTLTWDSAGFVHKPLAPATPPAPDTGTATFRHQPAVPAAAPAVEPEPEAPAAIAPAPVPAPQTSDAEADDLAETATDLLAEDEALSAYLGATPAIDEDRLRDIVKEVLRAELQGELGERITRNVRKLVRSELHRALSSQDFT